VGPSGLRSVAGRGGQQASHVLSLPTPASTSSSSLSKNALKKRNKKSNQSLLILSPLVFLLCLPKCCSWWSCSPDCPSPSQEPPSPPQPLTFAPQRTCSKMRVWGLKPSPTNTGGGTSPGEGWAEAPGARQGEVCCSAAGRRGGGGGEDPPLCPYRGHKMRHQGLLYFIFISSWLLGPRNVQHFRAAHTSLKSIPQEDKCHIACSFQGPFAMG